MTFKELSNTSNTHFGIYWEVRNGRDTLNMAPKEAICNTSRLNNSIIILVPRDLKDQDYSLERIKGFFEEIATGLLCMICRPSHSIIPKWKNIGRKQDKIVPLTCVA